MDERVPTDGVVNGTNCIAAFRRRNEETRGSTTTAVALADGAQFTLCTLFGCRAPEARGKIFDAEGRGHIQWPRSVSPFEVGDVHTYQKQALYVVYSAPVRYDARSAGHVRDGIRTSSSSQARPTGHSAKCGLQRRLRCRGRHSVSCVGRIGGRAPAPS
jgi:hypothetical protein